MTQMFLQNPTLTFRIGGRLREDVPNEEVILGHDNR
jgi:hypothetical protein